MGEMHFLDMLSDAGVELFLETDVLEGEAVDCCKYPSGAGPIRIMGLILENGKVINGTVFVDASYEGSLMTAVPNMTYTAGRESSDTYNESLAGVRVVSGTNTDAWLMVDALDVMFWKPLPHLTVPWGQQTET